MSLKGKKILLGITGCIAAYKSAELVRIWIQNGADVKVVMTDSARKFITPLTFETLTGCEVFKKLFDENKVHATVHINLADWADALVIAPATANTISKIRMGLADDLLSTIALAAWKKTIIAPAMNSNMWKNPAVQENINELKKRGYLMINPDEGELACGYTGPGRLADISIIDHWIRYYLSPKTNLKNKTVLVTAGRTEEEIDPVRMITNRSSGKMGFALAREAFFRGANVILVAGPNNLPHLPGIEYHNIISACEMEECVSRLFKKTDIIIASAAVTDYKTKNIAKQKIKRNKNELKLDLVANPDILFQLGKMKKNKILIGFALETEDEEKNALEKMRKKNLDMIIMNNPCEQGAGFAKDTNKVKIITAKGVKLDMPLEEKSEVAIKILDEVEKLIG